MLTWIALGLLALSGVLYVARIWHFLKMLPPDKRLVALPEILRIMARHGQLRKAT